MAKKVSKNARVAQRAANAGSGKCQSGESCERPGNGQILLQADDRSQRQSERFLCGREIKIRIATNCTNFHELVLVRVISG